MQSAKLEGGLVTNKVINGKTAETFIAELVASGGAFHEQLSYDTRGLLTSKVDSEGYETTFEYNAFTQLLKQRQQTHTSIGDKLSGQSGLSSLTSTFEYNARGELLSTKKTQGGTSLQTSQTYDAFGRVVTQTDANDNTINYAHSIDITSDKVGQVVVTSQNVDGVTREIETRYDTLGRKLSVKQASGKVTSYVYDDAKNSVTVTQADGSSVKTIRNGHGKVASVTQYDADGKQVSVSEYVYDNNGNLNETHLNGVRQSAIEYDKNNRVHRTTDAEGRQVETQYDKVGRISAEIVDPNGLKLTTSFDYTQHGKEVIKTSQVETLGGAQVAHQTTTVFDGAGNARSVNTQQGGVVQSQTQYSYDADGNKLRVESGSGANVIQTDYEYDTFGRLIRTQKGDEVTEFRYDNNNNLTEKVTHASNSEKQVTLFTYNEANELTFTLKSFGSSGDKYSVIEHLYNKDGQKIGTHRYEAPIVIAARYAESQYLIGKPVDTQYIQTGSTLNLDLYKHFGGQGSGGGLEIMSTQGPSQAQTAAVTPSTNKGDFIGAEPLGNNIVISASGALPNGISLSTGGQLTGRAYEAGEHRVKLVVKSIVETRVGPQIDISQPVEFLLSVGKSRSHYIEGSPIGTVLWQHELADKLTEFKKDKTPLSSYTVFDDVGRPAFDIAANGAVTERKYDSRGQVIEVVKWGQRVEVNAQLLNSVKDGSVNMSSLTKVGDVTADSKIRTIYNDLGQARYTLTLTDGTQASLKESRYDAAGNIVETIAYKTLVAYDSNSFPSTVSDGERRTQLYYDTAGRLRFTIDSNGYISEQRYNAVNDVTHTIAYAKSVSEISALATRSQQNTLSYDVLLNELNGTLLTDARVTTSQFNAQGKLLTLTHADGTTEHYDYYDNGLKKSYTNQKGATWSYVYDNSGRLEHEHGPSTTHHYWHNGALIQVNQASLTKSFDYDGAGNVIKITEGIWKDNGWVANAEKAVSRFAYDLAGNQTQVTQAATTNAQQVVSSTTYDALGRAIANAINGTPKTVKAYDAAGNLVYEMDVQSVASSSHAVIASEYQGYVTEYQYDALGQATSVIRYAGQGSYSSVTKKVNIDALKGNANNRQIDTTYDAAGRKQTVSQGAQKTTFTYNSFGEVVLSEQLADASTGLRLKSYT
ncbi:hypothetical protein L1286_23835, partial [Pseudoalteromonas sp. SMS1]|uniref:hypothetical protein n=1 Tax=Pseudoalteromonas sp. SMS1 TaxID=2908894 RepID=UPI001F30686D